MQIDKILFGMVEKLHRRENDRGKGKNHKSQGNGGFLSFHALENLEVCSSEMLLLHVVHIRNK